MMVVENNWWVTRRKEMVDDEGEVEDEDEDMGIGEFKLRHGTSKTSLTFCLFGTPNNHVASQKNYDLQSDNTCNGSQEDLAV
jgi:hypothetical protein